MTTLGRLGAGRVTAIVLAAGVGARAGGDLPKQYRRLGGRTLIGHAIASLRACPDVSDVLLVVAPDRLADTDMDGADTVIAGGASRRDSVARALDHLAGCPSPPTHVLIHDAARPFVPPAVIAALLDRLADGAAGATPAVPVADTLLRDGDGIAGDIVPRDGLCRVQTPQAFLFDALRQAHAVWPTDRDATDDAQMVRALGCAVHLVPGDARMEKITMAEDFVRVAALNGLGETFRTGIGYDVHRLEPGRPLWLCGVELPHHEGLAGHSDADVAIHALVDAILGALAEGDIGAHFPPSDAQWRGAPSYRFLAFARDRVAARGGRIVHIDVTIICEAPKIGPHREAMRARLGEILAISPYSVSVKATTTEGLGFTGRGEGIAAQAVATLALPDGF